MPEHVLFDNAKSVVIDRDAYGEGLHRWNDEMKESWPKPAAHQSGGSQHTGGHQTVD